MNEVHRPSKALRSQAATDFMVSYGFAMLIVSIAIYIVLQLSIYQPGLVPVTCSTPQGFFCTSHTLSANGTLRINLEQAVGTLNITGAACSSSVNSTGNKPAYGNIRVANYSVDPQFYPDGSMANGILTYSDTNFILTIYCYGASGVASGSLGTAFTGYVWLNYTSTALPGWMHTVTRAVQFTAKYS